VVLQDFYLDVKKKLM